MRTVVMQKKMKWRRVNKKRKKQHHCRTAQTAGGSMWGARAGLRERQQRILDRRAELSGCSNGEAGHLTYTFRDFW